MLVSKSFSANRSNELAGLVKSNKAVVQKNNNKKHSILPTKWLNTVTTKQRIKTDYGRFTLIYAKGHLKSHGKKDIPPFLFPLER